MSQVKLNIYLIIHTACHRKNQNKSYWVQWWLYCGGCCCCPFPHWYGALSPFRTTMTWTTENFHQHIKMLVHHFTLGCWRNSSGPIVSNSAVWQAGITQIFQYMKTDASCKLVTMETLAVSSSLKHCTSFQKKKTSNSLYRTGCTVE